MCRGTSQLARRGVCFLASALAFLVVPAVATAGPTVSIVSGPSGVTNDPTPTFEFDAEQAASVECGVDGVVAACSGPGFADTTDPLADGAHTFQVRAVDGTGAEATAERSFSVDTFVSTAIRRAPPERSARTLIVYRFRAEQPDPDGEDPDRMAEEPGATFVCTLDARPPIACSSPMRYWSLKPGRHRFEVTATDAAGNVDQTPATDTFTITRGRHRRP